MFVGVDTGGIGDTGNLIRHVWFLSDVEVGIKG